MKSRVQIIGAKDSKQLTVKNNSREKNSVKYKEVLSVKRQFFMKSIRIVWMAIMFVVMLLLLSGLAIRYYHIVSNI